jgi:hypothetical protein
LYYLSERKKHAASEAAIDDLPVEAIEESSATGVTESAPDTAA